MVPVFVNIFWGTLFWGILIFVALVIIFGLCMFMRKKLTSPGVFVGLGTIFMVLVGVFKHHVPKEEKNYSSVGLIRKKSKKD